MYFNITYQSVIGAIDSTIESLIPNALQCPVHRGVIVKIPPHPSLIPEEPAPIPRLKNHITRIFWTQPSPYTAL